MAISLNTANYSGFSQDISARLQQVTDSLKNLQSNQSIRNKTEPQQPEVATQQVQQPASVLTLSSGNSQQGLTDTQDYTSYSFSRTRLNSGAELMTQLMIDTSTASMRNAQFTLMTANANSGGYGSGSAYGGSVQAQSATTAGSAGSVTVNVGSSVAAQATPPAEGSTGTTATSTNTEQQTSLAQTAAGQNNTNGMLFKMLQAANGSNRQGIGSTLNIRV